MRSKLNKISGSEADVVNKKLRSCFSENNGIKIMWEISRVLDGEYLVDSEDMKDLGFTDMVYMMYNAMGKAHFIKTNYSSIITGRGLRYAT
jgi:ATP-dependent protease ClpP protease subunit